MASNGVRDSELPGGSGASQSALQNFLCHYACNPAIPLGLKPIVWAVMDSPVAKFEKVLVIGAGNAAAQVGATGVEVVLIPVRVFNPVLIGDPSLRNHTTWYVVQGGFNHVWREFVFP